MGPFEPAHLERFRSIIADRLGLHFDDGKVELLGDVLRKRLQARARANADAYLASLSSGIDGREEWRELAQRLTVTETYFFRGSEQFRALTEAALPAMIRNRTADRHLRLLSAGCASGEEAYSLAILLRERFPELGSWQIEILGLDVNPAVIGKARRARYHKWSLRETPAPLRDKYFRADGSDLVLAESIRSMVGFAEQNVCDVGWASLNQFDVALCRNIIMYLTPEAAQSVIASLTQALAPEGYLFLGYAETLRGLSQDFHLRHTHGAFYYQKRSEVAPPPARAARAQSFESSGPLAVPTDISWMEAVQRAAERIHRLSRECTGRIEPLPRGAAAADLRLVFELIHQERYREALEVLGSLPPETGRDPDIRILRAALLTNCGDLGMPHTLVA